MALATRWDDFINGKLIGDAAWRRIISRVNDCGRINEKYLPDLSALFLLHFAVEEARPVVLSYSEIYDLGITDEKVEDSLGQVHKSVLRPNLTFLDKQS